MCYVFKKKVVFTEVVEAFKRCYEDAHVLVMSKAKYGANTNSISKKRRESKK